MKTSWGNSSNSYIFLKKIATILLAISTGMCRWNILWNHILFVSHKMCGDEGFSPALENEPCACRSWETCDAAAGRDRVTWRPAANRRVRASVADLSRSGDRMSRHAVGAKGGLPRYHVITGRLISLAVYLCNSKHVIVSLFSKTSHKGFCWQDTIWNFIAIAVRRVMLKN